MLARLLLALGALAVLISCLGLRLNVSASLAPGIYRALDSPIERGCRVLVCLPEEVGRWAQQRGYIPRGRCPGGAMPLGKFVVAIAGDRVTVAASGVTIDGRQLPRSVPVTQDRDARPVPSARGSWALREGEVWLHSSRHPRSLDSRVFGPVSTEGVEAVLEPFLIWEEGP